jgi:putative tricarboxylic transport membrane protein
MTSSDTEIVVEDPDAPASTSPPVASMRSVEIVVYVLLIALAILLGYDNWRLGMGWAPDGPQAGYFPFYLSVIMGAAALYGLVTTLLRGADGKAFVNRDQLRRVGLVLVPTVLFCIVLKWLGIYVASFLLIAGFMRFVGRIATWKSVVTAFLFALIMFSVFEIAFDVIMPKGPLEAAFGF